MGGQNRIVVNYGDYEGLILLSAFDTKSGIEISRTELEKLEGEWELVREYKTGDKDYTILKDMISNDSEGFVIRFRNGIRIKIKGEEYVRLHRILTGFSNVDIWENLKNGNDLNEFLDRVPDEFDVWVKNTINNLNSEFGKIEKEYQWIYNEINKADGINDRKIFAEYALKYKHPSILFSMRDNRNYDEIIWKLIKPQYSKPFWQKDIES